MDKKRILLALGSPSDGKRLLGDKRLAEIIDSERFKEVEMYLSIASAHRTPDIVLNHAAENELSDMLVECLINNHNTPPEDPLKWLKERGERYNVIIGGAGLNNALMSSLMTYSPGNPIYIGLPIFDSATMGLTSLLSTQEMPPGCPVGAVGIDRIDAAVDLALDLATQRYEKVVLVDYANGAGDKCIEKLSSFGIDVEKMEIPQCESIRWRGKYENDVWQLFANFENKHNAVILFPYSEKFYEYKEEDEGLHRTDIRTNIPPNDWPEKTISNLRVGGYTHHLAYMDVMAREKSNIIIASYMVKDECTEDPAFAAHYRTGISLMNRTMHVRFGGIENMAILAARIVANTTGNDDIKQKLNADFEKGLIKYENWRKTARIESAAHLSDAVVECSR